MRLTPEGLKCRYKFPKETQQESTLTNDDGYYTYHPARNDNLIQRYNPLISAFWRANTDFSPIVSVIAVLIYIAKYAAKPEVSTTSYKNTIKDLCNKADDTTPAKRIFNKFMMSTLNERNYTAQEVIHHLMSWPLYSSTREFVTLTIRDEEWDPLQVS